MDWFTVGVVSRLAAAMSAVPRRQPRSYESAAVGSVVAIFVGPGRPVTTTGKRHVRVTVSWLQARLRPAG